MNLKITNLIIVLLLLFLSSCDPYSEKVTVSCERLNIELRKVLRDSKHPVCRETDLCNRNFEDSNNYCNARYKDTIGLADFGSCVNDITGNLSIDNNGVRTCDNYLNCIKDRDYKQILESNTLEYTTSYCAAEFSKTQREVCIHINEFFIRRLQESGGDAAAAEIEKHKAKFTDKNNNYCIGKYSKTKILDRDNDLRFCNVIFLKADFEKLKTFVGKEIVFKDCKN